MSIPISACLIVKAANGDERAYDVLRDRLAYNRTKKAFSVWGCDHQPPWETTEEKHTALQERLAAELGEPTSAPVALSDADIYRNLASRECLGCTGKKNARQSFCGRCYFRLPKPTRATLYEPKGYPATFTAALQLLQPAHV